MTIQQLIDLAERRVANLEQARLAAEGVGDVEAITRFDAEMAQTRSTINQLRGLVS